MGNIGNSLCGVLRPTYSLPDARNYGRRLHPHPRAKGLSQRVVFRKHAFRAGLTPIVTSAGLDLAGLLGGAVITEYIFSLPGLGRLAIGAVTEYDLPTITATVLVAAVFVIVANLVVDILYAAIDPRVRLT